MSDRKAHILRICDELEGDDVPTSATAPIRAFAEALADPPPKDPPWVPYTVVLCGLNGEPIAKYVYVTGQPARILLDLTGIDPCQLGEVMVYW